MIALLVIPYTIISGVVYAYLENRWAEKFEHNGDIHRVHESMNYRSAQIIITVLWLPLLYIAILCFPAYLAYKATKHFIRSS